MKLYLVSQDENNDYDTYSDFVAAAPNEEVARNTNPSSGEQMTEQEWMCRYSSWCSSPKNVEVQYLGEAREGIEEGVICASFHAG